MVGLSLSSIEIPEEYRNVRYDGSRFPGAAGVVGVEGGANCQQYAYALLRHHGFELPDFRSSELWADRQHTAIVESMTAFDLVLLHHVADSWGAHVGLCVGQDLVLHLSKRNGRPAVERLERLQQLSDYRYLLGIKRVLHRSRATV